MVADQNVQVNEQDVKRAWRHSEGGQGMTDKEIVDYLIELTAGTIDHFDLDDAMDLLYEVKATLSRRAKHEETKAKELHRQARALYQR